MATVRSGQVLEIMNDGARRLSSLVNSPTRQPLNKSPQKVAMKTKLEGLMK